MHKFELGVGQDFPLDETSPEEACGRRHRHHHFHHHHADTHHHRDDTRHHIHMAMLALLSALKDHRRHTRGGEGAV